MPKLHLINSHLGGMGKSLFSRVMLHLHQICKIPVIGFDADCHSYNLHHYYPGITRCIEFSDTHYTDTDEIIAVLEAGQNVVVNLASNASDAIAAWLERDNIPQVLEELSAQDPLDTYEMMNWFLTDGSSLSLKEFLTCLESYGQSMRHVLVKNLGRSHSDVWEKVIDHPAPVSSLLRFKVYQMEMPRFYQPSDFDDIPLSFSEILRREELNLLDLHRVEGFLEDCQLNIVKLLLV